jgi:hypothetical protein
MVLSAFNLAPKLFWFALLAFTVFLEVEPIPPIVYPPLFYSYKCLKGILFFALGYLTPLSFWRFNSLGRGVLLAILSAGFIEFVQGFFQGHRFSIFELLLKLVVIFVGFAVALNARYDQKISLGVWTINLKSKHFHS